MTNDAKYKILPSSAKALRGRSKYDYPFDKLEIAQSFKIEDKSEIKIVTLRPLVHRKGLQQGKQFRVTEHDDCYEVARVK